MIKIEKAMKSRRVMRALTGIDKKKFNNLLNVLKEFIKNEKNEFAC